MTKSIAAAESRSPKLTDRSPSSTSPAVPAVQSSTEIITCQPGKRRVSSQTARGTKTTEVEIMKDWLPAVVYSSPTAPAR